MTSECPQCFYFFSQKNTYALTVTRKTYERGRWSERPGAGQQARQSGTVRCFGPPVLREDPDGSTGRTSGSPRGRGGHAPSSPGPVNAQAVTSALGTPAAPWQR